MISNSFSVKFIQELGRKSLSLDPYLAIMALFFEKVALKRQVDSLVLGHIQSSS